jgi:hypothetical protein
MLTQDLAEEFATTALGHATREYPHKPEHVLTGSGDLIPPRALHPIFFSSFDWHSCVHAHWLLARLLRRFPGLAASDHIRDHFNAAFTPDNVSKELAYLARPLTGTFERPYGWAWLLMLAAELQIHSRDGDRTWVAALKPLAEAFARRFLDFLPKATYPVRSGGHSNTAFALALAMEYALTRQDEALAQAVTLAAHRWYLDDADCQAWEPGGEDFLSPSLIEAECMRRILPSEDFTVWFACFLPRLERREPSTLFQPVVVSDRSDGRIAHLDGLNLSRAWCWSNLATSIPRTDPRAKLMRDAAARHREVSIKHTAEDYMGEHWLATFALLALAAAEPKDVP